MKYMKILLLVFSIAIAGSCSAQLFKPMAKPNETQKANFKASPNGAVTNPLVQNSIRPLAGVSASILSDGTQLAGGVGLGFQHNKWDDPSQAWVTQYSISGLVFFDTKASITGGILVGLLNGLIQIGPGYNFTTKQFCVLTGVGIKFN